MSNQHNSPVIGGLLHDATTLAAAMLTPGASPEQAIELTQRLLEDLIKARAVGMAQLGFADADGSPAERVNTGAPSNVVPLPTAAPAPVQNLAPAPTPAPASAPAQPTLSNVLQDDRSERITFADGSAIERNGLSRAEANWLEILESSLSGSGTWWNNVDEKHQETGEYVSSLRGGRRPDFKQRVPKGQQGKGQWLRTHHEWGKPPAWFINNFPWTEEQRSLLGSL